MKTFSKLANFLGSLLFVEECRDCQILVPDGQAAKTVCPACWQEIPRYTRGVTWIPVSQEVSLPVISGAIYSALVKKLVYKLKYDGDRLIAHDLGLLAHASIRQLPALEPGILLPVPLHRSRLAARGYNQSQLLAGYLGRWLGLPVAENALVRKIATRVQHGLGRRERIENLTGAFAGSGGLIAGKNIILVDDVLTSGATLSEAARTAILCGAARVSAITAARTPLSDD